MAEIVCWRLSWWGKSLPSVLTVRLGETALPSQARKLCELLLVCCLAHTHACETHKMLDYARREPINICLLLNFLFNCIIWLCDLKNSQYRICIWGTLKEGPVFNYKLWEIIRASSKALSTITRFFVSAEKNMLFNRKPFLYHYVTTVCFFCFEAQMKTVHTVRKCESSIQLLCTVFLFQVCHSDHKYSSLPANNLKSSPWQLQGHNEHSSSTHYEQEAWSHINPLVNEWSIILKNKILGWFIGQIKYSDFHPALLSQLASQGVREAGYILDTEPITELKYRDRWTFILKFRPMANLESPVKLTCLFLDFVRKLECPDSMATGTDRTCRLHTKMPQLT